MTKAESGFHLLHNDRRKIGRVIASSLKKANEVVISVAFLKRSGLEVIKQPLVDAAKRDCSITIYAGTDFYQTEPAVLWFFHDLSDAYKRVRLFILSSDKHIFHPKLYFIVTTRKTIVFTGSSNLTAGGLSNNIEAVTCVETAKDGAYVRELREFLDSLETNGRASLANSIAISQYQRRYDVYHKIMRKAERTAQDELSQMFTLSSSRLNRYLAKYKANASEQADWRRRTQHYRIAASILRKMNRVNVRSKGAFVDLYEQLVGKAGQKGLWHSGSIFRTKNKVARRHTAFLKMVTELSQNIHCSPRDLFEIAERHFERIDGLGCNIATEILNTLNPSRFPVLNKNPLSSLSKLGFAAFPTQRSFHPETYQQYAKLLGNISKMCRFENLSRVDHFMNFVYWAYVKPSEDVAKKRKRRSRGG